MASTQEVRDTYADLEREMFTVGDERREEIQEILALARAQMADDNATNDRQRFGGQRTLSADRFAEDGFEMVAHQMPPQAVREEQEALEEGMRPYLNQLTMEQHDAIRSVYRYGFSFRESARRLTITTPALQRRIRRAVDSMRTILLKAAGIEEVTPGEATQAQMQEASA